MIEDALNVKATDALGQAVVLGKLEVSDSEDLARYRVARRPALVLQDTVMNGAKVTVYGNSLGAGVVTRAEASILGIGPREIEVDADFVPGNSGGPVVNEKHAVGGVATYILRGDDRPDWVTEATRYSKARRFTLRPSRIDDWLEIEPAEYAKQRQRLEAHQFLLRQARWTFLMLSEGKNQVSTLPQNWHPRILEILKNHNKLQEKPDSERTTYTDGFYTYSQTKSFVDKKKAQKRIHLRSLERFIKDEFGESELYRLERSLTIRYLRDNLYDGSSRLVRDLASLTSEIKNEVKFSK